MSVYIWEVEIDSDLGPLKVHLHYELNKGSSGDYDTPGEPPFVTIIKVELEQFPDKVDPEYFHDWEEEILDWELDDKSEDYYDKTER